MSIIIAVTGLGALHLSGGDGGCWEVSPAVARQIADAADAAAKAEAGVVYLFDDDEDGAVEYRAGAADLRGFAVDLRAAADVAECKTAVMQ